MKRGWLVWLPGALGLGLMALFYLALRSPSDHVITSQMVGKPLPEFVAPAALPAVPGV